MLECLILGDSIAVGVSQVKPECVAIAKGGWNSWQYNKDFGAKAQSKEAKTIIISLGANDHKGVKTYNELYKLREKLQGQRVFWILPNERLKPKQVDEVMMIAITFGDTVIPRPINNMSADGVHPTGKGYKELADKIK